jgi:hypothetical protein
MGGKALLGELNQQNSSGSKDTSGYLKSEESVEETEPLALGLSHR